MPGKRSCKLDLSGLDVRAKNVLRRNGVETVDKLLELNERQLSVLKNCGAKTIAKIMRLQQEYQPQPLLVKDQQATIDKAILASRLYMSRLIVVAIAANEVVEGAERQGRYYFRITRRRFNTLTQALEVLRKQQDQYDLS